jgi:hypothetical protein
VGGDHPAGHVFQAGALDPSRRPHPRDQQYNNNAIIIDGS